jgi:alkylated DNA nucleotide flippase Atl1
MTKYRNPSALELALCITRGLVELDRLVQTDQTMTYGDFAAVVGYPNITRNVSKQVLDRMAVLHRSAKTFRQVDFDRVVNKASGEPGKPGGGRRRGKG